MPRQLQSLKQLSIIDELVLPVSVTTCESAGRTTTPDVKPPYVFAIVIKRHANGYLEKNFAAHAGSRLNLCPLQILVTISDWMFGVALRASPHCCPLLVVHLVRRVYTTRKRDA